MANLNFQAETRWSGTTKDGYQSFSRAHDASATPAAARLRLSADESYVGDRDLLNPEQLLVIAASSCLMLTVLGFASAAGLDVIAYRDEAAGTLNPDEDGAGVGIVLRPTITVNGDVTIEKVEWLVTKAHQKCFIANSLARSTAVHPRIEVRGGDN